MDDLFKDTLNSIIKERGGEELTDAVAPAVDPNVAPVDGAEKAPGFLLDAMKSGADATRPSPGMADMIPGVAGGLQPSDAEEMSKVGSAVALGAAQSVIQTNDALRELAGDPNTPDKQGTLRKTLDAEYDKIRSEGAVYSAVGGISQFVTGLVGAGKLLAPLKAYTKGSVVAKGAFELTKGAAAGYFAMDPHEERLSNLIQKYPAFENPVNEYLAADPNDSAVEGRLKNALEGAGFDIAVAAPFMVSLKVLRYLRNGDKEGAAIALKELEAVEGQKQSMQDIIQSGEIDQKAGPVGDTGVRTFEQPMNVNPQTGELTAGKPKVRVKAGSDPMVPADQAERQAARAEAVSGAPVEGEAIATAKVGDASKLADEVTITAAPEQSRFALKGSVAKEGLSLEETANIQRQFEFDMAALDQTYGDRMDAMIQSGGTLAKGGSIPWQRIQGPEDMDVLVRSLADSMEADIAKAKGGAVLTDERVRRAARAAQKAWGTDPQWFLGEVAKGGVEANKLVIRSEMALFATNRMFMDSYGIAEKIRWGNLDEFGGDRAAALAEARRRFEMTAEVFKDALAIRAATGRNLRRYRGEFRMSLKDMEAAKGLDDETFLALLQSTKGDPAKIKEMVKPSFVRKVLEEAMFSMRNGLLWLYPTHVNNVVSNIMMLTMRPIEPLMGAPWAGLMGKSTSPIYKKAVKEFYYTWTSLADGWSAGVESFLKGDSRLAPHMTEWVDQPGMLDNMTQDLRKLTDGYVPYEDFTSGIANVSRASSALYHTTTGIPTRLLAAQDEFFKTVRYRAVVQARAMMDAELAISRGEMTSNDVKDFITSRLEKSFDEEGRGIDPEALYEAKVATFAQDLQKGTIGKAILDARNNVPALGLVLPFVKTPVNSLRYGHKYTPVLNMLQKEYRDAIMGKVGVEEQARAIGQLSLGGMFMGLAVFLAAQGRITGGGPKDQRLKSQLISQGWKPYAVRVTDADGKHRFVPFNRLDQPSMAMGLAADLYKLYTADPENRDFSDAATASAIAMAKGFSERSFLVNMNTLIDALSDPENNMERFLGSTAASILPASSAMRGYVNQDPYMRDARTLLDRVLKDMPGYSEGIPPKRDPILGEPLERRVGLTSTMTPDPVHDEYNRFILDTGFGMGPPNPIREKVDLRDLRLSDGSTAYDIYQANVGEVEVNGKTLKQSLEALINSDGYKELTDGDPGLGGTKINAFVGVVQGYRDAAYGKLVEENKSVALAVRMEQAKVIDKVQENRTGKSGDAVKQLLDMMQQQ